MFVPVVLALLGTTFSATLDPSLTKWRRIESNQERIRFPLKDFILEVKSFRPDEYDTNLPYRELINTDKPTTMMAMLYAGSWDNKVGRLVWNTIKYDRGYDVAIEECDAGYDTYMSFPAGGEKTQIWAWNFLNQDYIELTCNGEIQYRQSYDAVESASFKSDLPAKCQALGDADVDRIIFKQMAGSYIRGRSKDVAIEPTQAPTDPITEADVEEEPTVSLPGEYPTCDCWTRECGSCSKLECTVKHDLINSEQGIAVRSPLRWKKLNSIMLFDEDGNKVGVFAWNLKSVYLSFCCNCHTDRALRKMKRGDEYLWAFSLKDGVLQIRIGGEVMFEKVLSAKCARIYSRVKRFAFYDTSCENTFHLTEEMEAGEKVTPHCGGTCPRE